MIAPPDQEGRPTIGRKTDPERSNIVLSCSTSASKTEKGPYYV